ncbi:hypothetical protein BN159_5772 [Streptomyces davaonensis JCM 4913]|uniref:Effector-associated domain-containing protein n=1 Tax=Streptomyces davaonensis (strain DSM 101723 / JCM 4913 / KCC S-0913 / 768) TaxID=1214101 RepID=K4R1J3_STRDJ|nr:caspase family protein [Streptomyces davaonensis]CCK30151.1 hypothetical protein BN159_5772 [Streptomyces davaonensis JCM 4913]
MDAGAPARGRAVLVAVESYASGWSLDGPVRDILAYRDWLLGAGLRPEAITVLASPLPRNEALLKDAGVCRRPAEREHVHRTLLREVGPTGSDWLFVAWAGHGLTDLDGHPRLVYADARTDDLRCLDLNAFLAAFRSDLAPSHPRQLWVADACQTFVDAATAGNALRPDSVPRGRLRAEVRQRVLFACGPGKTAGQRRAGTGAASGLFSRTVLELLRTQPELRHDTAQLAAALRKRFQGAGDGVPTSLWFDNAGESGRTEARRTAPRRRPDLADERRLCEALYAVPVMRDPGTRAAVIARLPSVISSSVPRNSVARIEILELIGTCVLFENGLGHLWAAISLLDAGTTALEDLEAVLRDYPEWFTAGS